MMRGEFDPLIEMGFIPDRCVISSCRGIITKNNEMRELSEHYIDNGGHLYDVLERYDRIISYILNREYASAGSVTKWMLPFLKAYGVTDHLVHKFSAENTTMIPNAPDTFRYITSILPTFITTDASNHRMIEINKNLESPLCDVVSSEFSLDQRMFGRAESRKIKNMAEEIAKLTIPDSFYELNVPMSMMDEDAKILSTIDDILQNRLLDTGAVGLMESASMMTSHRKAYRMLDNRRNASIDLDCTMYIGSEDTDFQSLDLVSEAGGLSIAMNGDDFAVRGSNVAIMSDDATVLSIFASVFADKGAQTCMELANNWSREYLEKADMPDRELVNSYLKNDKIAYVHLLDDDNIDAVAEKSATYRKKILETKSI